MFDKDSADNFTLLASKEILDFGKFLSDQNFITLSSSL